MIARHVLFSSWSSMSAYVDLAHTGEAYSVAVKGSDNPISLEKPCQASLPPDQQGHHSLGRHPEVQYIVSGI